METETLTIADFLLARIAEDEVVAKRASRQKVAGPLIRWNADSAHLMSGGLLEAPDRAHIARHDPARVLAECEAKRLTVRFLSDLEQGNYDPVASRVAYSVLCRTALPYADHPDFRPEWRP